MSGKNVLILFGGMSGEHDISLSSATFILETLSRCDEYRTYAVGITKEGEWYLYTGPVQLIRVRGWFRKEYIRRAVLSPDTASGGLLVFGDAGVERIQIDCVFPVLHGRFGEDGTLQGLLEMSGIPFVGCGTASSAIAMDKTLACTFFEQYGIPHTTWRLVDKTSWLLDRVGVLQHLRRVFDWPVFVKPARGGSSLGISKVRSPEQLEDALDATLASDRRVIVEQGVVGREVEIAAIGGYGMPDLSPIGEIIPDRAFYDYDAKYESSSASKLVIPAPLNDVAADEIRTIAVRVWQALDCYGLARIDFFLREDGKVLLNEVNTIPGFVNISMYPLLFRNAGYSSEALVRRLIELAFLREDR